MFSILFAYLSYLIFRGDRAVLMLFKALSLAVKGANTQIACIKPMQIPILSPRTSHIFKLWAYREE